MSRNSNLPSVLSRFWLRMKTREMSAEQLREFAAKQEENAVSCAEAAVYGIAFYAFEVERHQKAANWARQRARKLEAAS